MGLTAIFLDVFDQHRVPHLPLNQEEIEYMRFLLSDNPEIFAKIEAGIGEIMADGRVDLHDLPQIVFLVSTIMHVNFISVSKKVDLLRVVQYMIDTIIESGILPLPAVELPILERVVDSSIRLLRMQIGPVPATKICWFC